MLKKLTPEARRTIITVATYVVVIPAAVAGASLLGKTINKKI